MDSKKKYEQMLEDGEIIRTGGELYQSNRANFIWVLDFEIGEVLRYNISSMGNEENKWNPDHEACEAFLYGAGHNPSNIEWMVTHNDKIIKR